MVKSLTKGTEELKEVLQGLEEVILKKVLECARKAYKAIMEKVDYLLMKTRDKALSVERISGTWYDTFLGPIWIKRRYYRDKEGRYHYLLDEILGLDKNHHITIKVKDIALELASDMTFRRSAEVLQKTTAVNLSHQTIWNLMQRVADPYIEKADKEIKHFMETGEIAEGEGRKITRLMVEADGVMLSLQRERKRKAELKGGIAYEGWKQVGKKRYSRYHLNRELCCALGSDKEKIRLVREACNRGEIKVALEILSPTKVGAKRSRGEQAKRIEMFSCYLLENSSGLRDYRLDLGEEGKDLRRIGAMEGNVDKLVVRRMKNQGMNWSIKGIRRMLCVRFMYLEGKLKDWLHQNKTEYPEPSIPIRKVRHITDNTLIENTGDWLDVKLPALYGSHASRPWVMALKSLTEVKPW